jgi:hypothetical protein
MALISMGLRQGQGITIQVEGPDEEKVCRQLTELFETEFDFPPREEGSEPAAADLEDRTTP